MNSKDASTTEVWVWDEIRSNVVDIAYKVNQISVTAQQRTQQNLFSSQAGSGLRPAGTASSSVAAPQGSFRRTSPALVFSLACWVCTDVGLGASLFASRGGCGSPSNCGASHGGHAAHLVEEDCREAGLRLHSRAEARFRSVHCPPLRLVRVRFEE